jgi:light-regulated signal transduction histidine kinase (bacteriophytochrome)
MRIVLDNLLGNAWKFTGRRDGARIELGSSMTDGKRAYFVRDNGAGFDMVYAGKLFAPFQRMHTQQQFDGTGIGLATVKRIIERHRGRIWIDSAVERGTTVYFIVGGPA